jgi:hypothetical protein
VQNHNPGKFKNSYSPAPSLRSIYTCVPGSTEAIGGVNLFSLETPLTLLLKEQVQVLMNSIIHIVSIIQIF